MGMASSSMFGERGPDAASGFSRRELVTAMPALAAVALLSTDALAQSGSTRHPILKERAK